MTVKDLKLAREKLYANNIECGLPGREDKISQIYDFLYNRLKIRKTVEAKRAKVQAGSVANIPSRHDSKTMLICGVPGTGKTVTVMTVLEKLEKLRDQKSSSIQPFRHVYINGQHLSGPQKVYTEILFRLTGINSTPENAQAKLDTIFNYQNQQQEIELDNRRKSSRGGATLKKKVFNGFTIIVIDELDLLYNDKRQTVFYSLFDWPTHAENKVILIGIANAMDLSERFIRSGRSRCGWEKCVFEAYTGASLQTILEVRLGIDLLNKCFKKEAVIVATRRIGKMTGDARRILDTCRLAINKAIVLTEENGKFQQVTPNIIDEVGFQNYDIQRRNYILACNPIQLLILKSILIETKRVGEENCETDGVYRQLMNLIKREKDIYKNFVLSFKEYKEELTKLATQSMIYLENNKNLPQKRLYLQDDSEALKDLIHSERIKF